MDQEIELDEEGNVKSEAVKKAENFRREHKICHPDQQ